MTSRRQSVPAVDPSPLPSPPEAVIPTTDPDEPPPGTPPPPRSRLFDLSSPPRPALPQPSRSHDGSETSDPSDGFGSPLPWTDDADDAQPVRKAVSAAGKKAKLKPVFRRAVQAVGAQLHTYGTSPDSPERDHGLWLADKEDEKGIADPLAAIVSRRVPSGVGNPDVTDGLDLALALLGYVMKNLQLRAAVRPPKVDTIPDEVITSDLPDDETPPAADAAFMAALWPSLMSASAP